MFKLETQNKPRGKFVRDTDPSQCVRVYRNSPEDLILQMWKGQTYMLVALSPTEARAIGEALVREADAIAWSS